MSARELAARRGTNYKTTSSNNSLKQLSGHILVLGHSFEPARYPRAGAAPRDLVPRSEIHTTPRPLPYSTAPSQKLASREEWKSQHRGRKTL